MGRCVSQRRSMESDQGMCSYDRKGFRRPEYELPPLLANSRERVQPLQRHQVPRREEPVLHVGQEVGATGHQHGITAMLTKQIYRLLQCRGSVVPKRRQPQHA